MEKSESKNPEKNDNEEVRIIDGKKYHKVPSGYTVREWYSHETPEKGPGPGWDSFVSNLEGICEKYGLNLLRANPNDLPDEPYYQWKLVEDK